LLLESFFFGFTKEITHALIYKSIHNPHPGSQFFLRKSTAFDAERNSNVQDRKIMLHTSQEWP
jgi:hypothetical protein